MKTARLKFPKETKKKKRRKHKESILQNRMDGTCYLCARLHGDYRIHKCREEHHIFLGNPGRKLSEAEGLKVYLCLEHHQTGPEAVHKNQRILRLLQQDAQRTFEKTSSRERFMELFGRNYIDE